MSLPGLGLAEPDEPQSLETTEHELSKESEWRFEVAVGKHVTVKVSTTLPLIPHDFTHLSQAPSLHVGSCSPSWEKEKKN